MPPVSWFVTDTIGAADDADIVGFLSAVMDTRSSSPCRWPSRDLETRGHHLSGACRSRPPGLPRVSTLLPVTSGYRRLIAAGLPADAVDIRSARHPNRGDVGAPATFEVARAATARSSSRASPLWRSPDCTRYHRNAAQARRRRSAVAGPQSAARANGNL